MRLADSEISQLTRVDDVALPEQSLEVPHAVSESVNAILALACSVVELGQLEVLLNRSLVMNTSCSGRFWVRKSRDGVGGGRNAFGEGCVRLREVADHFFEPESEAGEHI